MTEQTSQDEKINSLLETAEAIRNQDLTPQKGPEQLFIYFRVKNEYYALKLKETREIIPQTPIYKVPGCENYVLGVINLRGEIVPIIDLKRRLNLGESKLDIPFYIIVVKSFGEPIGLVVDDIEDIVGVSEVTPEEEQTLLEGKISVSKNGDLKAVGVLALKKVLFPKGD